MIMLRTLCFCLTDLNLSNYFIMFTNIQPQLTNSLNIANKSYHIHLHIFQMNIVDDRLCKDLYPCKQIVITQMCFCNDLLNDSQDCEQMLSYSLLVGTSVHQTLFMTPVCSSPTMMIMIIMNVEIIDISKEIYIVSLIPEILPRDTMASFVSTNFSFFAFSNISKFLDNAKCRFIQSYISFSFYINLLFF